MVIGVGSDVASLPLAPGARRLLGHTAAMLRDPLAVLTELPGDRPLLRLRFGPTTLVLVSDPQLIRQVFLDDRTFDKGGPLYDRAREVLGNGLVTCVQRDHRRQRRLCQPSFRPDRLPGVVAAAVGSVREMTGSWTTGQSVDVTEQAVAFATRALLGSLFSTALPGTGTARIRQVLTVMEEGIFRRTLSPALVNRLPLPANRRHRDSVAGLRGEVAAIVEARRAEPRDHGDLLSTLLGTGGPGTGDADRDVPPLSETEIIDQAQTFLQAGVEAVAATLAWSLHLLAEHPPAAERVRAEGDAVVGSAAPAPDHLPRLAFTRGVVTEALRLYPPAWFLTRSVEQNTVLGGTRLPAGTVLALSPYLLHRRPELHHRPHLFDPDRWYDTKPDPTGFLPFGAGARQCIGDRQGTDTVVTALAVIARNWRLTPVTGVSVRPRTLLVPRGLRLRVTAR
ncbi:cytochrome P450 [Streptomyces sp. NPDC021224]|uniref:cytochrome P450 n=1 Tax=unclassified Streptomyces TaxID=2593676 RepID=UPI0037920744